MTSSLGNIATGARAATWAGKAAYVGYSAGLGYELGSTINQVYTGGQKLADGNLWGLVDVGLGIVPAVGLKNALKFRTPKFAGSRVTPPVRAATGLDDAAGTFGRNAPNRTGVHKNSLDYVGDTHVYRIRGPNGTYKIGESAQGVRVRDSASIRGEQQARRLTQETGDFYSSDIRKTFFDKRSGRDYETRLIERFRRMFGDYALPGNKTNR